MKDAAVDDLLQLLRFASVSTDPAYAPQVRACADWVVDKLRAIGLQAEKHETPGHPVVTARNEHRAGRPTVMIYGHYDVQPADPVALWELRPSSRGSTDGAHLRARIDGQQRAISRAHPRRRAGNRREGRTARST